MAWAFFWVASHHFAWQLGYYLTVFFIRVCPYVLCNKLYFRHQESTIGVRGKSWKQKPLNWELFYHWSTYHGFDISRNIMITRYNTFGRIWFSLWLVLGTILGTNSQYLMTACIFIDLSRVGVLAGKTYALTPVAMADQWGASPRMGWLCYQSVQVIWDQNILLRDICNIGWVINAQFKSYYVCSVCNITHLVMISMLAILSSNYKMNKLLHIKVFTFNSNAPILNMIYSQF